MLILTICVVISGSEGWGNAEKIHKKEGGYISEEVNGGKNSKEETLHKHPGLVRDKGSCPSKKR